MYGVLWRKFQGVLDLQRRRIAGFSWLKEAEGLRMRFWKSVCPKGLWDCQIEQEWLALSIRQHLRFRQIFILRWINIQSEKAFWPNSNKKAKQYFHEEISPLEPDFLVLWRKCLYFFFRFISFNPVWFLTSFVIFIIVLSIFHINDHNLDFFYLIRKMINLKHTDQTSVLYHSKFFMQ